MKTIIILLLTFNSFFSMSQNSEEKAIVKLITGFELATAKQNVSLLEPLLNKHFRVTMNQLFGSTEVTVMDRSTYL